MPARNLAKWNTVPGKLQDGEYVDSRIYSDQDIFDKEIKTIFTKVWIPVCHSATHPHSFCPPHLWPPSGSIAFIACWMIP